MVTVTRTGAENAAPSPDGRFYVLHYALPGGADPVVVELLESERLRVVDQHRFASLTLYEVERTP